VSFESDYVNLLIKQYWEKPKANAEIRMKAGTWRKTFEWIDSFGDEFDLDIATGDRLDITGRIVGISRLIPLSIPKIAFGFAENPNSRGFDDKFFPLNDRAPFQDKFESASTDLVLMIMPTDSLFVPRLPRILLGLICLAISLCPFSRRSLIYLTGWPSLQTITT